MRQCRDRECGLDPATSVGSRLRDCAEATRTGMSAQSKDDRRHRGDDAQRRRAGDLARRGARRGQGRERAARRHQGRRPGAYFGERLPAQARAASGRWSMPVPATPWGRRSASCPTICAPSASRRRRSRPSFSPICIPTIPTAWSTTPARAIYPNAEVILHETRSRVLARPRRVDRRKRAHPAATSPRRASRRRPIASACARCATARWCRACRRSCFPAIRPAIPAGSSSRARTAC